MNSAKFYFDVYKRLITTPKVRELQFLEINTDGVTSSDMWSQLFDSRTTIDIATLQSRDVAANPLDAYDVVYIHLDDYTNIIDILKKFNLSPRPTGIHTFLLSSKSKFWVHSKQLFEDQSFWTDSRRFYSSTDLGVIPYQLKTPSGKVLSEYKDPEGMILEYR